MTEFKELLKTFSLKELETIKTACINSGKLDNHPWNKVCDQLVKDIVAQQSRLIQGL